MKGLKYLKEGLILDWATAHLVSFSWSCKKVLINCGNAGSFGKCQGYARNQKHIATARPTPQRRGGRPLSSWQGASCKLYLWSGIYYAFIPLLGFRHRISWFFRTVRTSEFLGYQVVVPCQDPRWPCSTCEQWWWPVQAWTAMLSPYLRFGDLFPRYVDWRVCQAGRDSTSRGIPPTIRDL